MGVHHILLTHSPTDRPEGYFCLLAVVNSVAMNTGVHAPLWDPAFCNLGPVTSPKPSAKCGAHTDLILGKADPQLPGGFPWDQDAPGCGLAGNRGSTCFGWPEAPPVLCPLRPRAQRAGRGPHGSPSGAAYHLGDPWSLYDFLAPSLPIWKVGIMTASSQTCWER